MSQRLLLASFAAILICSSSIPLAPQALARTVCDVNACIAYCQKNNPQGGAGRTCNSSCMITVDQNKKKGLCK